MKPLRNLAVGTLLAVFALPALGLAQTFEGKITQRQIAVSAYGLSQLLSSEGEEAEFTADAAFEVPLEQVLALSDRLGEEAVEVTDLTYYVTEGKMRIESPGSMMPGFMIMDFESGAFRMVIPFQKMYLEITKEDVEQLREQYGEEGVESGTTGTPEIEPLGMSKEINGMQCDAYRVTQGEDISQVWVSRDLEDVVSAFASFIERMEIFAVEGDEEEQLEVFELIREHGFPVMEQTLYSSGYEPQYEIMEILSVERGTPDAELFVIPEDYERRSFMEMMEAFGGGN
jgi:hypothetical protein